MSKIENNISYILIPFQYINTKSFETIIEKSSHLLSKVSFHNELYLGYIDSLYKKTSSYSLDFPDQKCDEIIITLFDTGLGFISIKYSFPNAADSLSLQEKQIQTILEDIKNNNFNILNNLAGLLNGIIFFPGSIEKNALIYNIIIAKINNPESSMLISNSESKYQIDKLHEFHCSSNSICLLTNQHYENIRDSKHETIEKEQFFRDKFENALLIMFMLLHHERRAYLVFRDLIVRNRHNSPKVVKAIKTKIMKLLSCYSYKLASEDVSLQQLFFFYREVLNLSEYETTLSDLIFRLDDELGKARENRITIISLLIAIMGLFQLISVILDLINYF